MTPSEGTKQRSLHSPLSLAHPHTIAQSLTPISLFLPLMSFNMTGYCKIKKGLGPVG